MTPRAAMDFAAGFGTRMRPLTNHTPKPLKKVAGKALLDHSLDLAHAADIPDICVNTHYLADQIHSHLNAQNIKISHEPNLLDTGGGLKKALPLLNTSSVYTMNSDAIWVGENPFLTLRDQWQNDMGALLLLAHVDDVEGRAAPGDFDITTTGRITRGGPYVYLGAQIMQTEPVRAWPDTVFSLNAVWDHLISQKQLYGCLYSGAWCDVGRPENIETAEDLIKHA